MPHADWPRDKWRSWRWQPPHRWIKGPYFTNRQKRREQMRVEWKDRGFDRKKVSVLVRVAEMRYQLGHQRFAYVKKKVMRRLGLNKPLNEWVTVDFIRVGALPPTAFLPETP